jgi:hypothetical protein
MTVAIVMPTIPRRAEVARNVVETLLPQCERFYVHLDGYNEVPSWIPTKRTRCFVYPQNRGPAIRYSVVPDEDVVLFVDDDLAHPKDYVKRSVSALEQLGRGCAIAYHAAWWPDGVSPEHRNRHLVGYWDKTKKDQIVTFVGSGTLGIRSDDLRKIDRRIPQQFAFDDDVWISAALARAGIRCVRPPSKRDWIGSTKVTKDGLYAQACADGFRRLDARIAEALALGGWKLAR